MEWNKRGEDKEGNTENTNTGRENGNKLSSGRKQFIENRIECEWLTTKEAALYLSITPNALRIMVHREQVPVYKFGRRLRFRLKDMCGLFERRGA